MTAVRPLPMRENGNNHALIKGHVNVLSLDLNAIMVLGKWADPGLCRLSLKFFCSAVDPHSEGDRSNDDLAVAGVICARHLCDRVDERLDETV